MTEEPKMKPIKVKTAYFNRIRDLRYRMMEERKIDISLADVVMEGVGLLEDRMGAKK